MEDFEAENELEIFKDSGINLPENAEKHKILITVVSWQISLKYSTMGKIQYLG